ncbi:efflux transporter, RND family, MFP subunit [Leptothrix cholodnii SP-6]|uniref:Efflux transporter, RND family, MFP subunit n=1 Tax=Leptothrix cholodnii (strain ATCC 51168 / LMG 8142 / SP-6) TaxID=395495 RepID=B1XZF4_LEPCP|nr:efflux RND transporter periplasmic adaptor subunit [Leptothrix cholodnii]ACB36517.1 efflux transporter, RND family, MFP subunit [Leptothrix cholodnii SP-6]
MNRKTLLIAAAGAVALAAMLGWAFAPRPVEVEIATAGIGPFETTLDEDARTRLRERYVVSAPLAGRLQRVTLREGDAVEAGAVLATLRPVLSPMLDERTLREQQARVGAAEAGVAQARSGVGAAQVALERAALQLRRTEQLAQQGFVAPTQVDTDRLAVQAAQQGLDAATEAGHVASHALDQARAALGAVRSAGTGRADGAPFALRAPLSARVLKVHHTSEATVALGAPLIELGDTTQMEIVAELLTTDALLARPGSAVRIERWGGPAVLQGRVRRIEPAAFTKVSALGVEEQRVNVLIDITSPGAEWAALGDGYRVGVRIVTRSESAVLRVPVSAVFPLPAGEAAASPGHAVFVVDAGHARLQPVKVAERNGSLAWIEQGLAAGAEVIVYPPASVADGVRVKRRGV